MKHLLPVVLLVLPAVAAAQPQPPAKPPTLAELNRKVVDILRAMHDRGADLYNAGDASGAVKVYQTALATVTPFVSHHPAILKAITDGLADAEKGDGEKAKAFRLHELIEQVRADLRAEVKKLEEAKKPDPVPPKDPPSVPKPALSGIVTLKGQRLVGVEVTVVSLNLPVSRVFTAKTGGDGKYDFGVLPPAEYAVIVTGGGVPAKYQTTDTSGLRAKVKGDYTEIDFKLE